MTELLGRDYWLVMSIPAAHTTDVDVLAHVEEHLDWLLKLEADGVVFLSGPLTSGPDVRPGSGVTVLRAGSAEEARTIALGDPFVRAGLRHVEVYGWRVNEGAIRVQISLGTGTYEWM